MQYHLNCLCKNHMALHKYQTDNTNTYHFLSSILISLKASQPSSAITINGLNSEFLVPETEPWGLVSRWWRRWSTGSEIKKQKKVQKGIIWKKEIQAQDPKFEEVSEKKKS